MKKIVFILTVLLGPFSGFGATLSDFTGTFKNVNSSTRGITKIFVYKKVLGNEENLYMRVMGKCHPQDCHWGDVNATGYSTKPNENLEDKTVGVTAIYKNNSSKKIVTVSLGEQPSEIKVTVYNEFKDNSGRVPYMKVHILKKQAYVNKKNPDLIVEDIFDVRTKRFGRRVLTSFKVTVKNIGYTSAGESYLRVIDVSHDKDIVRRTKPLAPGESVTMNLLFPHDNCRHFEAEADYKKMVEEIYENNNIKIWSR